MNVEAAIVKLEERTARFTILIDPRKKAVLERLSAEEDLTPSQVVRQLIREYIERRLGRRWVPGEQDRTRAREAAARGASKRRIPRV